MRIRFVLATAGCGLSMLLAAAATDALAQSDQAPAPGNDQDEPTVEEAACARQNPLSGMRSVFLQYDTTNPGSD